MKKFCILLLLLGFSIYSNAAAVEIDGIYYNLISKAKVAEVVAGTNAYTGSVTIPEQVTYDEVTYDVTTIQKGAFYGCLGVTSVTIPNSVITIGENAFRDCPALTSVTIGSGVKEIGLRAFMKCTSLTTITVPDNVTTWCDYNW